MQDGPLERTIKKKKDLRPLLSPESVALVGASITPDAAGNDMLLEILASGYKGGVYAVNPKYEEVQGIKCYPSLKDLPVVVDLVVLAIGNARLEAQLKEVIGLGIKAAVLFGSAYLENDSEPPLMARIAQLANDANMVICGAGAMGFYNLGENLRIFPQHIDRTFHPGNVAFISHSGSVMTALLWNNQKLNFNLAVSTGQELVTTAADYLDYMLDMPTTKVVAIFLEAVRDPQEFVQCLEKARVKQIPIVVLKAGRTEESAKLAVSHSGAIAGDDDAYQALFDRYGVIRVKSIDEMAETCLLLSTGKNLGEGRLSVILDSGGEREVLMDLACEMELDFARINPETTRILKENLDPGLEPINPLDAWGTGNEYEAVYENCLQALMDDENTAIGMLMADLTTGFWLHETFAEIVRKVAQRSKKPLVVVTNHIGSETQQLALKLIGSGVMVLSGTVPSILAIKHWFYYRDFLKRRPIKVSGGCTEEIKNKWRQRLQIEKPLDEIEGIELLRDFNIPVPKAQIVTNAQDAVATAKKIGFPVVLKTAMPGILHKSDVGGVVLDLKNEKELEAAYAGLDKKLGSRMLVTGMESQGVEVALGLINDPQFGPLVLVAAGGIFMEIFKDKQISMAPVDTDGAMEMINGLKIRPLLDGARGRQTCDKDALARALENFSYLVNELGDLIKELDVNPLILRTDCCVAVDALVIQKT